MISRFPVQSTDPVFDENHPRTNPFISTQSTRAYDAWNVFLETVFPAGSMDVEAYMAALKIAHATGKEKGEQALTVDQFKIHELRIYKRKKNPQHEYVLASVDTPSSDIPHGYLRFDRYIDESGRYKPTSHVSYPTSIPISDFFLVKDHVRAVQEPPATDGDDELIHTVGFNHVQAKRLLTLSDLAVLASTVHNHAPYYHALYSQCFWFAAMITKVLKSAYDHAEDIEANKKQGKFHGFLVQKEDPDGYEEVQKKFETDLAKFKEDVQQPMTQRERELMELAERMQAELQKKNEQIQKKDEELKMIRKKWKLFGKSCQN